MDKKTILITGASGGLGEAMADYFYNQGHKLILHHFEHPLKLKENDRVKHIQADLTNYTAIKDMFEALRAEEPLLDVVINNAGISKSAVSWKVDKKDWEETIALNLSAPFYIIQQAIPWMRENNFGRIINISSVVAQTGVLGTSAYAASKAGLIGLTKTLSKELISFNITVNALSLGYFNKGMIRDVPDEFREEILKTIPAKELGSPLSICKTIDFLTQQETAYITGQTININGGLYN
ncbi:MAG: SDR family oxidoreductase [Brumimicrobium sp.]|nr:SDR family oxidoreductase [Brumimicrobium sp.]